MQAKPNPELYKKLSEPFESDEAANAALSGFYEDLSALREKHKLRDVIAIVELSSKQADGSVRAGQGSVCFGDQLLKPRMLTSALFKAQDDMIEVCRGFLVP